MLPRGIDRPLDVPGLAGDAGEVLVLVVVRLELVVVERPVDRGRVLRDRVRRRSASSTPTRILKFHGRKRQLCVIQWIDVPPTALIIGPVAPSGRVAATRELGLVVGTSQFDLYRPYSFRSRARDLVEGVVADLQPRTGLDRDDLHPGLRRAAWTAVPPAAPRPTTTTSAGCIISGISVLPRHAGAEQRQRVRRLEVRLRHDVEPLVASADARAVAPGSERASTPTKFVFAAVSRVAEHALQRVRRIISNTALPLGEKPVARFRSMSVRTASWLAA